jgi:hypothetical protein
VSTEPSALSLLGTSRSSALSSATKEAVSERLKVMWWNGRGLVVQPNLFRFILCRWSRLLDRDPFDPSFSASFPRRFTIISASSSIIWPNKSCTSSVTLSAKIDARVWSPHCSPPAPIPRRHSIQLSFGCTQPVRAAPRIKSLGCLSQVLHKTGAEP